MLNKRSVLSLLSPWLDEEKLDGQRSASHLPVLQQIEVTNLTLDSRKITKGDTFVAIQGHEVDGRLFIHNAIEKGANAVIAQASSEFAHGLIVFHSGCPIIYIDQLDCHLSELSGRLYHNTVQLIGVTGTNGKTTITQLISQWIELLDRRSAVMGTTGNGFLDNLKTSTNTTGSAIDIHRTLAEFSDVGADYAAIEVSSHGLVQGRVKTLPFSAGVFTNLSRDHLDYHGTMQAYAQAKLSLFTEHHCKQAIINADDEVGVDWLTQLPNAVAVSIRKSPEHNRCIWAETIVYSESGIVLSFNGYWGQGEFTVPLIGDFNASNVLLSFATLLSLGFEKEALIATAHKLQSVIGRMELFQAKHQAKIVVDYAHTPDALEKALSALRVHCSGKLWAIFGCGGDRDTGKRPMMAEIAERLADKAILTDDNPRSEDPQCIVEDMLAGMNQPQLALTLHDRFNALQTAFDNADEKDIILLAGKGHEDYQVLDGKTIHYSDRESALTILGINQ